MKTIGKTNDGGFIVEMSHYEHEILADLSNVVKGFAPGTIDNVWMRDVDLAPVFYALKGWMQSIIHLVRLDSQINSLIKSMKGESE